MNAINICQHGSIVFGWYKLSTGGADKTRSSTEWQKCGIYHLRYKEIIQRLEDVYLYRQEGAIVLSMLSFTTPTHYLYVPCTRYGILHTYLVLFIMHACMTQYKYNDPKWHGAIYVIRKDVSYPRLAYLSWGRVHDYGIASVQAADVYDVYSNLVCGALPLWIRRRPTDKDVSAAVHYNSL